MASLPPRLKRFFTAQEHVVAGITSLVTVGGFIAACWTQVSRLSTDAEVDAKIAAAVAQHDHGHAAPLEDPKVRHPDIVGRLVLVEDGTQQCSTHGQELVKVWALLVRLTAADREVNRTLKKAAADFYEDEYDRLVARGGIPHLAYYDALRTPWYTRPRGY